MVATTIQSISFQFDSLEKIYTSIESDRTSFMASLRDSGIEFGCPATCGSCCPGFTPDVTRVESTYLASWILSRVSGPDLTGDIEALACALGKKNPGSSSPGTCPFHDPSRPGKNCTVYPARPLICRLFGYSGMRDRNGNVSFAFCKHMPDAVSAQGITLDRPQSAQPVPEWLRNEDIPVMAVYGWKIRSIPGNDSSARLLTQSLPEELSRLVFLNRLESEATRQTLAGDWA